jgi:acyl-CoA thioesterase-1
MRGSIELKDNQTILFIGDSITDADRSRLVYSPYGFGYVHFVAYLLMAKYPHLDLNITNTGISGNTVRDLKERWDSDCISYKPDVLSVLVGVNDACRYYAEPGSAYGVDTKEYEVTYRQLLLKAKEECKCQIVLMEPFMFCDDPGDAVFEGLQQYVQIVRGLADEFNAVLVPLQRLINEEIELVPPGKWSEDSVHPYVWAHAWIAKRWLETTGLI